MKNSSGFQLRIQPHSSRIFWFLCTSILSFGFFALIILQRFLLFHWTPPSVLGFMFFLAVLGANGFLTYYFFRIFELKGSAVTFGAKGWKDSVSIFFLGHRALKEIQQARICLFLGLDCLELQLSEEVLGKRKASFWRGLYLRWIGHRIYIPLVFFDISRMDLETQFLHLQKIIDQHHVSSGTDEFHRRVEQAPEGPPAPPRAKKDISLFSQIYKLPQKGLKIEGKAQAHPIFAEVARRKTEFHAKGLDRLVCDLFVDFIRDLPEGGEKTSKRAPVGLSLLRSRKEEGEYEEVEFSWEGLIYQMGLRTNLEEGNEALLTFAADHEVKVSLKVGVEIGILDPRDLERYLPGPWEDNLRALDRTLREAKAPHSTEPVEEVTQTKTSVKVEELKKNFGLKDE
jgi:hypothetical protein